MTRDRWWVACCAVLGILAGCDRSADVVRARRFELVDAAGEVRAVLAVDGDGTGLVLLDAAGRPGVGLTVLPEGRPGLTLLDAAGVGRAGLVVNADGSSVLSLHDAVGTARAALQVNAGGNPVLGLGDAAGDRCRVVSCP